MLKSRSFRGVFRSLSHALLLSVLLSLTACGASSKKGAASPADADSSEGSKVSGDEAGTSKKKAKKAKDSETGAGESTPDQPDDSSSASAEEPTSSDAPPAAPTQVAKEAEPPEPKKAPRPAMKKKAQRAFDAGKKAFAAGDLQGASAQFEAAVAADPKAYEAHYALGVIHERLGRYNKAQNAYKQAFTVVPDYEESIVAYGILVARQGNHDAAMSFLKKKSGEVTKSAPILAATAEVASLQGQSGEAQRLAQEALKVDPSHKPAMVTLARDHYRARRIDLALYALTGILDGYGSDNPPRDKNNAEAHMIRGLIYAERGLRGPAMEEMEKALKVRPDLVDAHLVLANFMMEAGNAKGARKHLEMAIRYDNKNITAHLQLGDAYRLLNKADDAKRELEWVLSADPNQAAAHYNLGLLYLLGGKVKGLSESQLMDKAIEHLEAYKARAIRGGPDDVEELITRAKTKKALLQAQKQEGAGG